MITMKIWGGLGNQLFEYAFGYALAKRSGKELILDMDFFSDDANRKPLILDCAIEERSIKGHAKYDSQISSFQKSRLSRLKLKIFSKIGIGRFRYTRELGPFFSNSYMNGPLKDYNYFDGYWQCEKYFLDYADDLRRQFVPQVVSEKVREFSNELRNCDSVSLHIRRGDYTAFPLHPTPSQSMYLLDFKYYINAIKKLEETFPDSVIYCFSDDIPWCKEMLSDFTIRYVDRSNQFSDLEEFYLMSRCKNHIIANSTYSWWAAWLNSDKDKTVICPDRWFGNQNIFPESWLKINRE